MDDTARPQPKSRTRMPGRSSTASVSHSVSHKGLAPPLTLANKDTDGNDRNFRFRHGKDDTMNAAFGDGHVASFQASKKNLSGNTPNGGSLHYGNIMLDFP